jgi:hypothetical protein
LATNFAAPSSLPRPAVLLPCIALAALLAALHGCGDGVDVSIRRATGEARTYARSVEIQGVNPVNEIKGRVREEVTTTEKAVEVIEGDRATLQVTVDRVVMQFFHEGPEPVATLDSAKDEPPKGPVKKPETEAEMYLYRAMPMRYLAGGRVEVDVKPSGRILRVVGGDDLRKAVLDHLGADDPRRAVAEKVPWESLITNLLRPALLVPERGAAVGDSGKFYDMRTLPESTGTGGFMYYAGTWRFAKVENGIARMETEAEVSLDPPSPDVQPWPRAMAERRKFLRLQKGTCRAWARIRVDTGVVEEEEHLTELDLHFVRPDGKGEVPIPTKVIQRSKLVPK